jgi:hypothetical protein
VAGRRLSSAAAIVVLGVLALAGSAQACSCAPTTRGEAIERADAAIAGRLLEVVPQNRLRAVYRYKVQRVYKGGIRIGQVVSVASARDSAACGLPTRTQRRYELVLSRSRTGWTSGTCGLLSSCTS